ncbi:MAG: HAD family phosphatase [Promethearchaeota archaeon]|nr:MAG: HAD family phosphatase [Candidatus Lokiarchaeota archaeon]
MKIKAIIFDLGGVIIDLDFSNFYNKIITQSPLNKPQTPIMLEFFRQSDIYHQGIMTDDEFYQLACDLLQVCMVDQSEFFDAFNSIISGVNPKIIPLLKKLRDSNQYKLIALSNVNSSHWDYIINKKWEFIDFFDIFILSHEIHLVKPNPKIFEYAIKKAGCKPQQIIYVDDGLNNIRTANRLGIKGIKYSNIDELIKELKKYNAL